MTHSRLQSLKACTFTFTPYSPCSRWWQLDTRNRSLTQIQVVEQVSVYPGLFPIHLPTDSFLSSYSETLPVEFLGGQPLCMNQYYQILSSCRVPGPKQDSVVNFLKSKKPPTHITVVHNYQVGTLPCPRCPAPALCLPLPAQLSWPRLLVVASIAKARGGWWSFST